MDALLGTRLTERIASMNKPANVSNERRHEQKENGPTATFSNESNRLTERYRVGVPPVARHTGRLTERHRVNDGRLATCREDDLLQGTWQTPWRISNGISTDSSDGEPFEMQW